MSGPLTLNMDTPRALLAKARRERKRLKRALASQDKVEAGDALFNFAVTGFHLKDWIKRARPDHSAAKEVERYINETPVLEGCRDICNSGKHFALDSERKPKPDVVELAASNAVIVTADVYAVAENVLRVTGEDQVSIPRKFLTDYTVTLPTRIMVLTNETPRFADGSGALPSRFLILKTNASVVSNK